jgi:hypothetical protein
VWTLRGKRSVPEEVTGGLECMTLLWSVLASLVQRAPCF